MIEPRKVTPPELGQARERFLELVADVRPELHRYCARLSGSVVEGEDIVQEALARAFYAVSLATEVPPLRPLLFRVAHNTAVDFLRRYDRRHVEPRADFDDRPFDDEPMDPLVLRAALATFLALPVAQRSAVILKDVLDHSLEEIAEEMSTTVAAVKSLLVRGRAGLRAHREQAEPGASSPAHADRVEREQLQRYVSLFNERNWDGLRALMAEEVRLDLVAKASRRGHEVSAYFGNYAKDPNARVAARSVDGRPALVFFSGDGAPPYCIFLEWSGGQVSFIRDFRYVPYILKEAELRAIEPA